MIVWIPLSDAIALVTKPPMMVAKAEDITKDRIRGPEACSQLAYIVTCSH